MALFSGGLNSSPAPSNIRRSTASPSPSLATPRPPRSRTSADPRRRPQERGFARNVSYIPVWVTNEACDETSPHSGRGRSFRLPRPRDRENVRQGPFTFYENGVVSVNPPLAGDVLGGRATRTTHPRVLRGLEALFSALLDRPIQIRTPLQWLTKSEVVLKIREAGMADLLATTNSCTRPRIWTKNRKHCGVCSQCIDRRFAILAAAIGEVPSPPTATSLTFFWRPQFR